MVQNSRQTAQAEAIAFFSNRFMKKRNVTGLIWGARTLLALAVILVVYFSLSPNDSIAGQSWIPWDKAKHHITYFGLCGLALIAFSNVSSLWIGLAVLFFSIVVELAQPIFGRTFSVFDILANLSGVLAVLSIAMIYYFRSTLEASAKALSVKL